MQLSDAAAELAPGASEVSDVVWAAFWGALIGFLGVIVTVIAAARRQQVAHAHEVAQREAERVLAVRRAAFAEALTGVSALTLVFSKLTRLDVETVDLFDQDTVSGALDGVCLVGGDETVRVVMKYQREASAALVRLMGERSALMLASAECKMLDDLLARERASHASAVDALSQAFDESRVDPQLVSQLVGNIKRRELVLEEFQQSRTEAGELLAKEITALVQKCTEARRRLGPLAATVISAMRKELGFEANEASLLALLGDAQEDTERLLEELFPRDQVAHDAGERAP